MCSAIPPCCSILWLLTLYFWFLCIIGLDSPMLFYSLYFLLHLFMLQCTFLLSFFLPCSFLLLLFLCSLLPMTFSNLLSRVSLLCFCFQSSLCIRCWDFQKETESFKLIRGAPFSSIKEKLFQLENIVCTPTFPVVRTLNKLLYLFSCKSILHKWGNSDVEHNLMHRRCS